MTTTTPTTPATATTPATGAASGAASGASSQSGSQSGAAAQAQSQLGVNYNNFLKLLTAQIQNQDPLEPMKSEEFAVQLATFSGVEQQVRTNQLLESLASGIGMSGISQLAGWVGMEARVAAPAAFDGTPVTLAPDPDPASDAATLVVRDEFDRVVSREAMPMGVETILWAGVGDDGAPLPPGRYTFQLESLNSGEITSIRPVEHYATVDEARQGANGIEVVLRGGTAVPASEVTALRRPAEAI